MMSFWNRLCGVVWSMTLAFFLLNSVGPHGNWLDYTVSVFTLYLTAQFIITGE